MGGETLGSRPGGEHLGDLEAVEAPIAGPTQVQCRREDVDFQCKQLARFASHAMD